MLCQCDASYQVFDKSFAFLFNSYYESIGARQQRSKRSDLTRPSIDEIYAYRAHVDQHISQIAERVDDKPAVLPSHAILGIHHEQQHQCCPC